MASTLFPIVKLTIMTAFATKDVLGVQASERRPFSARFGLDARVPFTVSKLHSYNSIEYEVLGLSFTKIKLQGPKRLVDHHHQS